MAKPTMFRAYGMGVSEVSPETRTIKGVAVITKGEAKTHFMQIDDKTLDQVVALGNVAPIKSRFGHPGMFDDPIGTYLGELKNFRKDGSVVRADLLIDELADQSPKFPKMGTYVLNLAAKSPTKFGASIVFAGDRERMNGVDYVRVTDLNAVDVTDTPAANPTGLFSICPDGRKEFAMADAEKKKDDEVPPFSTEEIKQCRAMLKWYAEQGSDSNATQKDIQQSQKPEETKALSQADIAKAREEEREANRKYETEFAGIMTASQFKAEEREEFRKDFYGQPIDAVKKFAAKLVEKRTQPVGEGGGSQKDGNAEDPVATEAKQRFAENKDVRRMFGVTTDDANSEQYKKGMERYVASRVKIGGKKS